MQHFFVSKEKQANVNSSNELPKYSTLVCQHFFYLLYSKFIVFFSKAYPICGGLKSSRSTLFPYYELVITGLFLFLYISI